MPKKKTETEEQVQKKVDEAFIEMLRKKVGLSATEAKNIKLANEYISINDVVSTGHGILDSLIVPEFYKKNGRGGVPRGFLCEFFGPNTGGKTTIAMKMAASVTKSGGYVFWQDAEHSFMETWAENHGVDLSHVVMSKDCNDDGNPFFAEQFIEELEKYVGSGAFQLAVVDSMEALVPKQVLETKLEDNARIGEKARLMSRSLPRIVMAAKKGNCTVIFINQIRQNLNMGSYSGPTETTPGGEALRFYASLRLRVSQVGGKDKRGIMKDGEEIGIRSNVLIKKSRFGPPFRETVVPIYYGKIKPHALDLLLDDAMGCGLIRTRMNKSKSGDSVQTFYVKDGDGKPIQGLEDLFRVEGMDEFKALLTSKKLNIFVELMKKQNVVPDPEVIQWMKSKENDDPLDMPDEKPPLNSATTEDDDLPPEEEKAE